MADSPIQRIKQLDQERTSLIETARNDALARAKEAVAELHALGFEYQLIEDGKAPRKSSGTATRIVNDSPCPICKFQTQPSHDGRRHRAQGKRKRPFSPEELKDLGFVKA